MIRKRGRVDTGVPPRLCTYLITNDTGLAPNPFHGWCTLAVCTPNHQGAKLAAGDWIAGFLTKDRGYRFVYAMEIEERLHMNDYFYDQRFQDKKPDLSGDWLSRCGDNFYSLNENGSWRQHRNRYHLGEETFAKDTKRPYVFVGRRFWYFGQEAGTLPHRFASLAGGRGIRVNHSESLVNEFLVWVSSNWDEGVLGLPNDNPDLGA